MMQGDTIKHLQKSNDNKNMGPFLTLREGGTCKRDPPPLNIWPLIAIKHRVRIRCLALGAIEYFGLISYNPDLVVYRGDQSILSCSGLWKFLVIWVVVLIPQVQAQNLEDWFCRFFHFEPVYRTHEYLNVSYKHPTLLRIQKVAPNQDQKLIAYAFGEKLRFVEPPIKASFERMVESFRPDNDPTSPLQTLFLPQIGNTSQDTLILKMFNLSVGEEPFQFFTVMEFSYSEKEIPKLRLTEINGSYQREFQQNLKDTPLPTNVLVGDHILQIRCSPESQVLKQITSEEMIQELTDSTQVRIQIHQVVQSQTNEVFEEDFEEETDRTRARWAYREYLRKRKKVIKLKN